MVFLMLLLLTTTWKGKAVLTSFKQFREGDQYKDSLQYCCLGKDLWTLKTFVGNHVHSGMWEDCFPQYLSGSHSDTRDKAPSSCWVLSLYQRPQISLRPSLRFCPSQHWQTTPFSNLVFILLQTRLSRLQLNGAATRLTWAWPVPFCFCHLGLLPPSSAWKNLEHLSDTWFFSRHPKHFNELGVTTKSRRMSLPVSLALSLLSEVENGRRCFGFIYNRDLCVLFTQHCML